MIEDLQYLLAKSTSLYQNIGLVKNQEINIKMLEEAIRYFKDNLQNLDLFINQKGIDKGKINNSKSIGLFNAYEKNREILDHFLIQIESAYRILYMSNKTYDIYQNEQDSERKKFLLSSYFLQYEKEYRTYQGAKVLELNISDKDILEKIRYLLLEVQKVKKESNKKEKKDDSKKDLKEEREEKKTYIKLEIDQKIKTEFSSLYGRNTFNFRRPYDRQNCITALNEMNDFFLEHNEIVEYIKNLDVNSLDYPDKMIVEQMQRILNDIKDFPDILSNKTKRR